jgi:hypothetical protein
MAQEFTPEELGLPSTPQEFTPEELGLSPTATIKKEFTPEELGITPTISAETKPEDAGFLARTKQALTEGFESFGGVKRGLELGSVATDQDMAAAAAKMQEIKAKGEVPPAVQTLSASDIQRIAEEKGILPAGMQVPSFVVEQILKSGPEMAVPLLTGYAATVLSAPTGIAAPFIGAAVGIGTYGVQQYGHFMERQALEKNAPQELDPASAKKWAAITAPLGYVVDRFTLGLGKGGAKAGQAVVKELAERKGAAIAKGAGVGAVKGLSEVPTEVLEQAAERYQAGLPLSGDEANKEYFEAGWGALAVGSGLGGAAGAYGKYKEVKAVTNEIKETTKAKDKVLSDDLEDAVAKQPSRDDVKEGLFDQIKDQAETIKTKRLQAKAKPIAEPVEDEIEPSSILDEATLTSLGFRKSSNAFKSLIGKDISMEETRALLDQVAENNPTKVNEETFTNFKASLPPVVELTKQPTPTKETADAKPIQLETRSEADRASVRALDESKRVREDAGRVEGRELTGVDTTGSDVGQPIGRAEPERAALTPETTEVLKTEEELTPLEQESRQVAAQLQAIDPENALIQTLRNPLEVTEQDVAQAKTELAAIKEQKAGKGVTPLAEEKAVADVEKLPSKIEGTPEGKAIVNTTKPAKTLGQALTILNNQHFDKLNPVQKVLHRVISKLPNVTKGTYKVMGMEKGEFGSYAPLQNKTTISPDAGVDTIFHEATHSATTIELKKHVTMKNGRPVARTPQGQKMVDIFDAAEVAAMQQELDFGETFLNMDEFIANAYNNEDFQRFLAGERSVIPDAPPTSTLWSDFVNSVKQLLNLGDISNTLLSDVLSVTPDLFTGTRQVGTATIPDFGPQEKLYSREKVDRLDKLLKDTNIKTEKAEETKAFQEFKDDPAQFVKNKQKGFQRFLDKAETNFFSSDAALSNAIRRGLEENGEWEETKKVMYSISTSQALHAEAPAHQFLEDGNIAYDKTLHKYVVSKAKDSWKSMMQTVKTLADKYGVPYEKMEQYAHVAMIAQRLKGLKDFNRELKEDVVDLLVEGKDKEAKKMWDKNYKHIHMTTKEINAGLKLFDEIPELNKIVGQWNGIREKVLKFGIDSGLYSADQVEALLDVMDYVPFYRVEQLEQNQGPKEYTRGLLDRALTDPKFKGSNQPVNNVFDNMERWITYVIRKGINNKTAQNLVKAADEYLEDEVTKIPSGVSSPRENTIAIWQNGGLNKYKFNDPLFVKAFTGMETVALPMFPKMAKIANILRQNIVLYPLFSVSQVFQDAYSAMVTSGVDNPFGIPLEVMKEIIKTSTGVSQARKQLKSVGAVGIRDYSAEVSKLDAEIAAGMKKPGFFDRYIKNPLQKFSMASDNVIRQAIYAQTMKETGDKALATERAFEVINFRRTGSNKLVSVGRQVIPFFGAYLQSLNVMMKIASGRGIAPSQRAEAHKVLRNTIMKTMILSFFYAALTADDDDYEKLDPSIRDRRFVFPGTGGMSIPIRPDLASLITKVIPEHVYHRYIKDDEDATKMWKSLGGALANAVTGPSPYPQALKTVGELAYNYDMFTGRPIVGTGPAGKEEEMQYTARTSEMAKVLGDYTGTSPMKWDHFLDGYLGYTAGLIRMATNPLMADIRGDVLPSKSVQDYITELPGTSAFIAKEFGTRAKNDYYELRNEVDRAYATYKDKQQFRGPEETEAYLSKDNKRDLIVRKGLVDDLGKYLSQLRKMERSVMEDKYMSPDEKQQKLRFIKEEEAIMFDHLEEFKGGQAKYIQKIRREAGL